jgi:hypothetical protein
MALFLFIQWLSSSSYNGSLLPHTMALFLFKQWLSSSSYNGLLRPHTMAFFFLIQWLSSSSYKGSLLPHTCAVLSLHWLSSLSHRLFIPSQSGQNFPLNNGTIRPDASYTDSPPCGFVFENYFLGYWATILAAYCTV